MKLKIRTLKQDKYEFDIDDTTTVGDVKKMIEDKYQHKISWQILIFSGKVLASENTIKSYNVTENDFLVLMVKKPKEEEEKPQERAQSVTPAPALAASAPTSAQPGDATPAAQPSAQTPAPAGTPQIPFTDPVSGQSVEAMVDQLAEMGFPRDQALLALRASFFNPDRAVEYLTNGIPQGVLPQPGQPGQPGQPQQQRPVQQRPAQPTAGAGAGAGGGGIGQLPANLIPPGLLNQQPPGPAAGGGIFDLLRNHPQFPALQQIAREHPNRLTEILTQLAQTNPEIIQLIVQHREEFIRLLAGDPTAGAGLGGGGGGGGGGGAAGGGAARGPQPGTIMVTPEDQRKIENLVAITGASRERVMQAYFLFEKDETTVVNYILNNPEEDYEEVGGGDQ